MGISIRYVFWRASWWVLLYLLALVSCYVITCIAGLLRQKLDWERCLLFIELFTFLIGLKKYGTLQLCHCLRLLASEIMYTIMGSVGPEEWP